MELKNRYRNTESMIGHGNPSFTAAKEAGLLDLSVHNTGHGSLSLPDGREFFNTCSCSYLGLDSHPDVLQGAIEVLQRERTMTMSISRLRVRLADLDALEEELTALWRAKTVVTNSASSASAGLLPLIASGHLLPDGQKPILVFDKSAHFSMNLIKPICADETHVITAPHNDLDFLEDLCRKHARVAYVADGFYSMGGVAIVKDLFALQDKYGLFLYFDDSHSLSIYGGAGEGYVRAMMGGEVNSRTIIIGSLGKGFGTAGGAIMLGPGQHADLVGRFAGPLGWSQSLAIPAIGASLASARIHGGPELAARQQTLRANVRYFDERVPTRTAGEDFPIKIIDVGPETAAVERSRKLMERGFYASAVFFPIVPKGRAGLRIMLRSNITPEDLQRLCDAVVELSSPES
ncbi:aminotransferase class I/II-fold pyridoxal phosphate-dependent enzyme [Myxococcus llanfairpwllgwyngyllgogerychwyrndrobwllllantysiliogogogochensis]|uniref:Aminotransferase class I/II-fold pyridoxal phosphate-dependent enzyme n=1 Tax=Myxococcus llanfairpwllgwyngyllgogerychwyrndrobwllllantysiliogogogochensis TaxID=2590453 RepID=A0A540X3Z2_9BACT|nr:aminotransferase class I/II-fold pyridoxal phosphate-dependent enzyme [Myxococcus llanfairpwllgwyngyllgogerychwyrndrobwllllantysiliogogogochensis]TQF15986.1 aminotransferase class I/II-fold pyridoxal phosphate-dependent enzyme [Myxococcus llanfairpwllgwyngyllgogerychwyrndrobwllllantysiliogogogochensis]